MDLVLHLLSDSQPHQVSLTVSEMVGSLGDENNEKHGSDTSSAGNDPI